jgi:hypothetical protein
MQERTDGRMDLRMVLRSWKVVSGAVLPVI